MKYHKIQVFNAYSIINLILVNENVNGPYPCETLHEGTLRYIWCLLVSLTNVVPKAGTLVPSAL